MKVKGILLAILLAAVAATAAEPQALLNFQGRIFKGNLVVSGTGYFKFALVNANGAEIYWLNSADSDNDSAPDLPVELPINRGLYSVMLGDTNIWNMGPISPSVFTNNPVFLRVWFGAEPSDFELLAPDQRVAPSGYALLAGSVLDGSIGPSSLAPGTLDAANITGVLPAGAIPGLDASKITSGTVPESRLPANIAYTDRDLADLEAKINALSNRLETVNGPVPESYVVASELEADPGLLAKGFSRIVSFPKSPWTNGSNVGSPSARAGHSGIWTGQEYLIFGGTQGGSQYFGSGGAYNPETDTWTTLPTLNAPSARTDHSAVWTGHEMIVWGGSSPEGFLGTGAIYDVTQGRWTALPTSGAPGARAGHIAVWTGKYMVVWGGWNGETPFADGGLYDPVLNQWKQLQLPNPPTARIGAGAVWAGDRILVWGGEDESGALNTGAQLLFDSQGEPTEWRAVAQNAGVQKRTRHTVVWTGSRMVVFGGMDGGQVLNNGGIYNPANNTWELLSTEGVPAARYAHNAVWTGSEMIVAFGKNNTGDLASAARFLPGENRWIPLDHPGPVTGRSDATMGWTGREIIVFGGNNSNNAVGALQKLNPQPAWHLYRKL